MRILDIRLQTRIGWLIAPRKVWACRHRSFYTASICAIRSRCHRVFGCLLLLLLLCLKQVFSHDHGFQLIGLLVHILLRLEKVVCICLLLRLIETQIVAIIVAERPFLFFQRTFLHGVQSRSCEVLTRDIANLRANLLTRVVKLE